MKKIFPLVLSIMFLLSDAPAQKIPYGISKDTVTIVLTTHGDYDTLQFEVWYYKPLNYDSLTSPNIIWNSWTRRKWQQRNRRRITTNG